MFTTTLTRQDVPRTPLEDIALGPAWLRVAAAAPGATSAIRFYRPAPTLAFSGRDCLHPAIAEAAAIAREHGFTPVRRGPGGRATAYHGGCLGIDQIGHAALQPDSINDRFRRFGATLVDVLRESGLPDAALGEVPGEYCPGEYSVHDGRGHKVVGTAQRLTGGAWLFSSMIVVTGAADLAAVLDPVYRALDLPFEPATVGAVDGTGVGLAVQEALVDDLVDALATALTGDGPVAPAPVPDEVVQLARTRAADHLLPGEELPDESS